MYSSASPGANQDTDGYIDPRQDSASVGVSVFVIELSDEDYLRTLYMLESRSWKPLPYSLGGGAGDAKGSESCVTFVIYVMRFATGLPLPGLESHGASPWLVPDILENKMRISEACYKKSGKEAPPWREIDPKDAPKVQKEKMPFRASRVPRPRDSSGDSLY